MSADVEAIARRWHTNHDRGAHDYTDEGCRILAEHAFRDIASLAAVVTGLREQLASSTTACNVAVTQAESARRSVAGLREALEQAEAKVAAAEDGYTQLRAKVHQRPEDTESRDTYADGFTAGLIEAMWVLNRAALAASAGGEDG